jgi:5'(3')-deoxyribonucleotidase
MERRFVIAVDMDEVLVDTYNRWLEIYNNIWDDDLTKDKITSWAAHDFVKPECGEKMYDILNIPGFFSDLDPLPGAIEGVKELMARGHEIVICTATPKASSMGYHEKRLWIEKHIPGFDTKNFISTHRKDLVSTDILIDDGIHNIRDFQGIAICIERPWNVMYKHEADAWARNWDDVMEILDLLEHDEDVYFEVVDHSVQRISEAS